ncbi:hypothetical protein POUND7_018895 [Theobroma cacao]
MPTKSSDFGDSVAGYKDDFRPHPTHNTWAQPWRWTSAISDSVAGCFRHTTPGTSPELDIILQKIMKILNKNQGASAGVMTGILLQELKKTSGPPTPVTVQELVTLF